MSPEKGIAMPDPDTLYTSPAPTDAEEELPLLPIGANPRELRRTFSRLGFSLLSLIIGLLVGQYAVLIVLSAIAPEALEAWWVDWVLSLVPLYGFGLPLMLLSLVGVKKSPHNTDCIAGGTLAEKPRFHLGHWMLLLVIAFSFMYIGGYVGSILMAVLSALTGVDYQNSLNTMVTDSPLWMVFFAICICAPLGEELIFRKLLIDRTRRFGDTVSILTSGLCFGLFHGNFFQFFYAAIVGMLLAYLYTRTGKYWLCVAMHAVINFTGSILVPRLSTLFPTDMTADLMDTRTYLLTLLGVLINTLIMAWIFAVMIAGIILLILLWRRRKLSRGPEPLLGGAARYILLNPGMIANGLGMGLLMALSLLPPSLTGG